MNLKALLNSAQHTFMPINLQIRMESALHQHPRTAKLDRLTDFLVDRLELQDVSFLCFRPLQRPIKRTERTKFCAEVCVVDVAVSDVGDHAVRMQFAANGVGFHADPNEI